MDGQDMERGGGEMAVYGGGEMAVYEDGAQIATLRISREGLYTRFRAELPPGRRKELTRLYLEDREGRLAPLGLLEPVAAGRRLSRRLTRLELGRLPADPLRALALPAVPEGTADKTDERCSSLRAGAGGRGDAGDGPSGGPPATKSGSTLAQSRSGRASAPTTGGTGKTDERCSSLRAGAGGRAGSSPSPPSVTDAGRSRRPLSPAGEGQTRGDAGDAGYAGQVGGAPPSGSARTVPPPPPRETGDAGGWRRREDGSLVDPERRLLALPCQLRGRVPGLREMLLDGQGFLIFRY